MKTAHLKPLENTKSLDEMSMDEIIGRPAHQKATRILPHYEDAKVETPRPTNVINRLKELAKKVSE